MTYYEKKKMFVLTIRKHTTKKTRKKLKKYTKSYYELNKDKMKQKRKGNIPVKRKQKKKDLSL